MSLHNSRRIGLDCLVALVHVPGTGSWRWVGNTFIYIYRVLSSMLGPKLSTLYGLFSFSHLIIIIPYESIIFPHFPDKVIESQGEVKWFTLYRQGLSCWCSDRNPLASAGDTGLVPGLGRSHMLCSMWARVQQ